MVYLSLDLKYIDIFVATDERDFNTLFTHMYEKSAHVYTYIIKVFLVQQYFFATTTRMRVSALCI